MLPDLLTTQQQLAEIAHACGQFAPFVRQNLLRLAAALAANDDDAIAQAMMAEPFAVLTLFDNKNANATDHANEVKLIAQLRQRAAFLDGLRNAMVFLPLLVTWLGISASMSAYYDLITAQPALADQSFIYLWEGGFGGRTTLTLSTIAFLDGILLVIIFIITIAADRVYRRAEQLAQEMAQNQDLLLAKAKQTAYDAALLLSVRRVRAVEYAQRAAKARMAEKTNA